MVKNYLKKIYYKTSDYTGVSNFLINKTINSNKLILTYHNVLPEKEFTPYFTNYVDLTIDVFKNHLKFLIKNYGINDISTISDMNRNGIYLSFDDAMLNNIEIVAPILNEYGITAMFAACSSLVNGDVEYLWRDEIFLMLKNSIGKKVMIPSNDSKISILVNKNNINENATIITNIIQQEGLMHNVYHFINEIKEINNIQFKENLQLRYGHMSLNDLRNLKQNGHIIASHTQSHKKLFYLTDKQQYDELKLSKEYFEKNIGKTNYLVYPYGTFNEVNDYSLKAAKEIGYKNAYVNFINKSEDNFSVSRLNLTNIKNKSVFKGVLARINKI